MDYRKLMVFDASEISLYAYFGNFAQNGSNCVIFGEMIDFEWFLGGCLYVYFVNFA